jgi:DNA repair exonuclease SbcCD ATPase subunit
MLLGVEIDNFPPFGEGVRVRFPARGLTAITGEVSSKITDSNGAGKSMLLAAIEWCLFDTSYRTPRADDVINKSTKKGVRVKVTLNNRWGQVVEIDRYRKHKEHKNSVFLIVNGDAISGDKKFVQERIKDAVGFDHETFRRAFLFTNDNSLATTKDADIKSFFETLIGVDFSKAHDESKNRRRSVESEITSTHGYIQSQEHELVQGRQAIQQALIDQTAWQQAQEQQRLLTEQQHAEIQRQIQDRQHQYQQITEQVTSVQVQVQQAQAAWRDHQTLESKRQQLAQLAQFNVAPAQETCPTCGQNWPQDKMQEKRAEYEARVQSHQAQVAALQQEVSQLEATVQPFNQEAFEQLNVQTQGLNQQLSQITQELSSLNAQAGQLQSQLQQTEDPYAKQIEFIQNKNAQIETTLEEQKAMLESKEHDKEVLDKVVKMFSREGLRSFILDLIIPFLNSRLDHYAKTLTEGEISAEFQTTTHTGAEKFNVAITRNNGGDSYASLSSGEQRRIDLCMVLAVVDYIRRTQFTPILFFDELFDHLDKTGAQMMVTLLQQIAQELPVYVVTHNPDIASLIENEIKVVRPEEGFSYVV